MGLEKLLIKGWGAWDEQGTGVLAFYAADRGYLELTDFSKSLIDSSKHCKIIELIIDTDRSEITYVLETSDVTFKIVGLVLGQIND